MGNNEDWKKLEKWAENEKIKKENKYKIDIDSFYKKKEEKNKRRLATFKKTKTIFVIIVAIFIMIVFTYYKIELSNFKQNIGIDLNIITTILYSK